jgi:hypothetical protein
MNEMIVAHREPAALSAIDRVLIGQLRALTSELDRHGLLANLAAKGPLLPSDILERDSELRTELLTTARDRCRRQVRAFKLSRLRRRVVMFMLPYVFGAVATIAIAGSHLLA